MDTPETKIKKEIKAFLNKLGIFWYWNYNDSPRCYKGLPDLVLHFRGKVVYIEVKTPEGGLSKEQKEFQKRCEYDDIDYWVINSVDSLITHINNKKAGVL